MKFLCPHCGCNSNFDNTDLLDTGQYLVCSQCNEDVIIDFSTPQNRTSVYNDWIAVFGHLSQNANEAGDLLFDRISALENKLHRVRDWFKFHANSKGGFMEDIIHALK